MEEEERIEGIDAVVQMLIELSGHPGAWCDVPADGLAFGFVPLGQSIHVVDGKWHEGRRENCAECGGEGD